GGFGSIHNFLVAVLEFAGQPGRAVVHILAGKGSLEEVTGEEVGVDKRSTKVPVYFPIKSGLQLVSNVSGVTLLSGAQKIYGNSINSIVGVLAPKKIPVGRKLYFVREMQFDRGVQVNDVGRPNQIGFAEVSAFGKQGIERTQCGVAGIAIATGYVRF